MDVHSKALNVRINDDYDKKTWFRTSDTIGQVKHRCNNIPTQSIIVYNCKHRRKKGGKPTHDNISATQAMGHERKSPSLMTH